MDKIYIVDDKNVIVNTIQITDNIINDLRLTYNDVFRYVVFRDDGDEFCISNYGLKYIVNNLEAFEIEGVVKYFRTDDKEYFILHDGVRLPRYRIEDAMKHT